MEWTFPLDFAELVWGDGDSTHTQAISATDLAPFSFKKFSIPFDAAGKKWVRFAVWDSAGNGAFTQPVRPSHVVRVSRAGGARRASAAKLTHYPGASDHDRFSLRSIGEAFPCGSAAASLCHAGNGSPGPHPPRSRRVRSPSERPPWWR